MVRNKHSHKFTIADDEAVNVLVKKLVNGGKHRHHREKLLRALDDAMRHYVRIFEQDGQRMSTCTLLWRVRQALSKHICFGLSAVLANSGSPER